MSGGALLILGHRVKGQDQLQHSAFETLWAGSGMSVCPIAFKLHI